MSSHKICFGAKITNIILNIFTIITLSGVVDLSLPKIIKLFSCSTQLSMKFVLLINLKLLTIANSFLLNIGEHENFSANKYGNCWHFHIY